MRLPRDRFGQALLWVAGLYLISALLMPVGAFWTPDAGAKYAQMLNVHWTGAGFDSAIAYPARDVDPELRLLDLPFGYNSSPDGLYRTFYPMAFAVLSRGAYTLFGLRGLILLPMLAGLLTALFAGLIVERWRPGHGWIAILLTAFATPVLFYSQIYWEHTLALAFALAGVWVLAGIQDSEFRLQNPQGVRIPNSQLPTPNSQLHVLVRSAVGLALVAVSCLFRVEMLLFLVCCVGWSGFQLWRIGSWGRIAVAAAGVAGLAAAAAVGATTGYAHTLGPGFRDVQQRIVGYATDPAQQSHIPADAWQRLLQVFYNVPDAGAIALQPLAYLTLAALALAVAALFASRWRAGFLAAASAAIVVPAAVNVFYPGVVWSVHGLVLSCPLILAAIAYLRGQGPMRGLIAASFIVFALAEVVFLNWGTAGGREWGARGVLIVYPLAALVVAASWPIQIQNSKFKIQNAALWAVVLVSVGTQARGLVQLRSDLPTSSGWTRALQDMPPSIVATDIWWLTSTATPVFYRHRFVLLPAGPDQAGDAAYLASQSLTHALPVVYATLCTDHCALPAGVDQSFQATSGRELNGLWLAQMTPRGAPG